MIANDVNNMFAPWQIKFIQDLRSNVGNYNISKQHTPFHIQFLTPCAALLSHQWYLQAGLWTLLHSLSKHWRPFWQPQGNFCKIFSASRWNKIICFLVNNWVNNWVHWQHYLKSVASSASAYWISAITPKHLPLTTLFLLIFMQLTTCDNLQDSKIRLSFIQVNFTSLHSPSAVGSLSACGMFHVILLSVKAVCLLDMIIDQYMSSSLLLNTQYWEFIYISLDFVWCIRVRKRTQQLNTLILRRKL